MSNILPDQVYLMKAGDFYKIGVSKTPRKRLRRLQTGCPRKIELIYAFEQEDAYALEFALHDMYQKSRTHGEWFTDIDVNEFLRAVEAYDIFKKNRDCNLIDDKFGVHFRKYDTDCFSIYMDIVEFGQIRDCNKSCLKNEYAAHAINSGIKERLEILSLKGVHHEPL